MFNGDCPGVRASTLRFLVDETGDADAGVLTVILVIIASTVEPKDAEAAASA